MQHESEDGTKENGWGERKKDGVLSSERASEKERERMVGAQESEPLARGERENGWGECERIVVERASERELLKRVREIGWIARKSG